MRTPAEADEARYVAGLSQRAGRAAWPAAVRFAAEADRAEAALGRAWDLVSRWGQGAVRLAADGDAEGAASLAFAAAELADVLEGVLVLPPWRPPPGAAAAGKDAARASGERGSPLSVGRWRS